MRREIQSTHYGFNSDKHPYNAWIHPNGEIIHTSFTHHRRCAESIVRNNEEWYKEFKKSNKNKKYDEAEFLIIVKGFISINSGHFNFASRATYKQKIALGCDPYEEEIKMDMFFSD